MRGKRAASVRYSARHLTTRKKGGHQGNFLGAEERAFLKFVVCGAVFVLIVALKLLFPDSLLSFGRSAALLIGADADFQEAFAAMGRAVSGEETVEDSLKDAYTAVFNPSSAKIDPEVNSTKPPTNEGSVQTKNLMFEPGVSAEKELTVEQETNEQEKWENKTVSCFPALPENASMEQRNLGFLCVSPVRGTLTSSFGWREHPVVGDLKFHYGLDFAAELGTEIYAFADGEVFATGESSTLGKYIILTHSDGYRTLYGHCSMVVKLSGSVAAGEVIATVGESGITTGPHLHFELQNGTLYLNPIYYVDIG